MKVKIKNVYESIEELKAAADKGKVKEGDELITKDYDGKCRYIIIKTGEEIHMVRKYLLSEDRPMRREAFNLQEWLKDDYKESLKSDLRKLLVKEPFLLSEKEVFGENDVSDDEEGEQYEYFKKCKNRIATYKKDDAYSRYWWLRSVVLSAYFALVDASGNADYTGASHAYGVRPALIISVENA